MSIEDTLRAAWSNGALAAYADQLQLAGDPRGELIAFDLDPKPGHRGWAQRRRALLAAWLGELADRAGHLVQHGFAHELRDGSHPRDLLDSPLGTFVRGYTVWGSGERVTRALARLAARPRPWLQRVTVARWHDWPPPIPAPLLGRVKVEPEPALAEHELALLLDAIDEMPDVNRLYATYEHAFSTPVPRLLARAHAAGLVELAGPFARRATVERGAAMVTAHSDGTLAVQEEPAHPWMAEPWQPIGPLAVYGRWLADATARLPLAPAVRERLVSHLAATQQLHWRAWVRARAGLAGDLATLLEVHQLCDGAHSTGLALVERMLAHLEAEPQRGLRLRDQ